MTDKLIEEARIIAGQNALNAYDGQCVNFDLSYAIVSDILNAADAVDDKPEFSVRAFTVIAFRELLAEKQELIAALASIAAQHSGNPASTSHSDCMAVLAKSVLAKHGGV